MFGLGLPELILILIIALVVVGPGKLPQAGASIGKAIAEMRAAMDKGSKQNTADKPQDEREHEHKSVTQDEGNSHG